MLRNVMFNSDIILGSLYAVYRIDKNKVIIVGQVYGGKQFNRLTFGQKFYKVTNSNEFHYFMKYNDGLNIDIIPFNPIGECKAGGLYFTDSKNIGIYYGLHGFNVREVTIPDDARVYVEVDKYKADRFILGRANECEFEIDCYRQNGLLLGSTKDKCKTTEICQIAIGNNPKALKYVNNQTPELCKLAIQLNPNEYKNKRKIIEK